MKRFSTLILWFFLVIGASSCHDQTSEPGHWESSYKPILMPRAEFENDVQMLPPRVIEETGKIFLYQQTLFLSQPGDGIHIIDNADPENPELVGFLKVLGNSDMAFENGLLYANQATDLLTIDLSNPQQPVVTSRVEGIFPQSIPPDNGQLEGLNNPANWPEDAVLVGWELK